STDVKVIAGYAASSALIKQIVREVAADVFVENLNVLRPGPRAAAEGSPSVKIIGTFPADSHPAIVYPVAATLTAKPEAAGYLAYLRSMTAKAIFEQHGFIFLADIERLQKADL